MTTFLSAGITATRRLASMVLSSRRDPQARLSMVKAQAKTWPGRGAKVAGILPVQAIRSLIAQGHVRLAEPLAGNQLQPASLDLRLGPQAYRMRSSCLLGPTKKAAEKPAHLPLHSIAPG